MDIKYYLLPTPTLLLQCGIAIRHCELIIIKRLQISDTIENLAFVILLSAGAPVS